MAKTWAKSAFWLTILDGVPRYHERNVDAIQFGQKHGVLVFRQDWSGRITVVYEPSTNTTFLASKALYVGDLKV